MLFNPAKLLATAPNPPTSPVHTSLFSTLIAKIQNELNRNRFNSFLLE